MGLSLPKSNLIFCKKCLDKWVHFILLKEKTRRILNELNIYDIEFDECEMKLDSSEIFIYGCVRKALGLNYNKRYIKHFEKRGTLWGRSISVEEYIRQYKLWYENN